MGTTENIKRLVTNRALGTEKGHARDLVGAEKGHSQSSPDLFTQAISARMSCDAIVRSITTVATVQNEARLN